MDDEAILRPRRESMWEQHLLGHNVRCILRSNRVLVGELIEETDRGLTFTTIEEAWRNGMKDDDVPQGAPLRVGVPTTAFVPWHTVEFLCLEPDEPYDE